MHTHKTTPALPQDHFTRREPKAADRRGSPRNALSCGARLRRVGAPASRAARTRNASDTGLLIEITGDDEGLAPGARVEVLIARYNEPLVRAESFVPARVVRVNQSSGGRVLIALAYERAGAVSGSSAIAA